jgi:hypothetical protein
MLKIEKMVTMSPEQWEIVIEGMRNPHDSWDKMDSYMTHIEDTETGMTAPFEFFVGDADQKLMETLRDGGPVHAKYRRMMPIWMTINAPLYWWKEFDTYKVGTVCNSCSTMHRIHAKEFTLDDFSQEHLINIDEAYISDEFVMLGDNESYTCALCVLEDVIAALNFYRNKYLEAKTKPMKDESKRAYVTKRYWWQMIQLLPSSYNQKRTVMITYEVVANMRKWRWNHKQDEWRTLCQYLEDNLPYVELTDEKGEK